MINVTYRKLLLMGTIFFVPAFAGDSGLPMQVNGRQVISKWEKLEGGVPSKSDMEKASSFYSLLQNKKDQKQYFDIDRDQAIVLHGLISSYDLGNAFQDRTVNVTKRDIGLCKKCAKEYTRLSCYYKDCEITLVEQKSADRDTNKLRDTDKVDWIIKGAVQVTQSDSHLCTKIKATDSQEAEPKPNSEYHQATLERPSFFYAPQKLTHKVEWFNVEKITGFAKRKAIELEKPKLDTTRVGLFAAGGFLAALVGGLKLWSWYTGQK